ncbi:unnamed protein product [Amoebophrya sp. A120]|nr:unnamed protein product [Amoebophrya sp. A120]|eukprot:GSA120T00011785001.1
MLQKTKRIFLYWQQGWEHAPPLVQDCRRSWELHNTPSWEIVLLSGANVSSIVDLDAVIVQGEGAAVPQSDKAEEGYAKEDEETADTTSAAARASVRGENHFSETPMSSLALDSRYWQAAPDSVREHPYRRRDAEKNFFLPVATTDQERLEYLSTFIFTDALRLELLALDKDFMPAPASPAPLTRKTNGQVESGRHGAEPSSSDSEEVWNVWADATMLCLRPLDDWLFRDASVLENPAGFWLYAGLEHVIYPQFDRHPPHEQQGTTSTASADDTVDDSAASAVSSHHAVSIHQPAIWFLIARSGSDMLRRWRDAYRRRWARRRREEFEIRVDPLSQQVFWTASDHASRFFKGQHPATTEVDTYFLFEQQTGLRAMDQVARALFDDVILPVDVTTESGAQVQKEVVTNSFNIFSLDQSFLDLLSEDRMFFHYWADVVLPLTASIDSSGANMLMTDEFSLWSDATAAEAAPRKKNFVSRIVNGDTHVLKMSLKNRPTDMTEEKFRSDTFGGLALRLAMLNTSGDDPTTSGEDQEKIVRNIVDKVELFENFLPEAFAKSTEFCSPFGVAGPMVA